MFRSLKFKIALLPALMIGGLMFTDSQSADAAGPVMAMHRMHMARRVLPVSPIVRPRIVAPIVSPVVTTYRAPLVVRPMIRPVVRPIAPVRYIAPVVTRPVLYPATTITTFAY